MSYISIKKQAPAKASLRHVVELYNSSNHKPKNTGKEKPCGGTKGTMLSSRKWRRVVRWGFACILIRQTAVYIMIGVLRNIHSRHGLVVREMAARWFLS
jgi:hypothetical protein